MKAILPLTFVAALVAFVLFPINFEIAGSILTAAAIAAIAVCDYSQTTRRRPVSARVAVAIPHQEKFGLAA